MIATAKTTTCDIDKDYFSKKTKEVFEITNLEEIQSYLTEWGVSLPDGMTLKDLDEVTDLYYLKGKKIQQKLGMVYPIVFVEGNSDSFGSFFIINQ